MSELYIIKENLDYFMGIKGIKKYSVLLRKIGIELGYHGDTLDNFPSCAKANFSKMLKRERKLNAEYIIPLEKILGISISKLIEPSLYYLSVDKEEVPFVKGIKYYAYMDDMDLYINELAKLSDSNGNPIICNNDEYGKSFIDYIVEYKAYNGMRFLIDYYNIKLKWHHSYFQTNNKLSLNIEFKNTIQFTEMISTLNDSKLFFDIYDTYNMFISNDHYGYSSSLFENDEFFRIILSNETLFNSLFNKKEYLHECSNYDRRKLKKDSYTVNTINPIINKCLNYALSHLDKFKKQAVKILKFAISYNKTVIEHFNKEIYYYPINELGRLYNKDGLVYNLLIYSHIKTNDNEVNNYIEKLPKIENGCFNYYNFMHSC